MWGIVISALVSNPGENCESARVLAISPDAVHQLVAGWHVRCKLNEEGAHDLRLFVASYGHASDARRERIELLCDRVEERLQISRLTRSWGNSED